MKKFCSQCGKELKKNILICSNCGFKNKVKRGRKLLIPIVTTSILIVLGTLGYLFRNQIESIFENPADLIAQLRDPDYVIKQNFKDKYERFLLELDYYDATMAFPLSQENANDYESVGYKVDGSTNATTQELYEQRISKWQELEGGNCFVNFNSDSNCSKIREEIIDLDYELSMKIYNKESEYRFCGSDNFEHFIPTCKAALDWKYRYSQEECSICNDRIQELLTLSSSAKSQDLAEALLNLTAVLEEYNEISQQIVAANRKVEEWKVAEASNQDSLRIVNSLSSSELKTEYEKEEYAVKRIFLQDIPITKVDLTNYYNESLARVYNQMDTAFEERDTYSDTQEELSKSITSYTSVLNGAFSLNLSKP